MICSVIWHFLVSEKTSFSSSVISGVNTYTVMIIILKDPPEHFLLYFSYNPRLGAFSFLPHLYTKFDSKKMVCRRVLNLQRVGLC